MTSSLAIFTALLAVAVASVVALPQYGKHGGYGHHKPHINALGGAYGKRGGYFSPIDDTYAFTPGFRTLHGHHGGGHHGGYGGDHGGYGHDDGGHHGGGYGGHHLGAYNNGHASVHGAGGYGHGDEHDDY